MAKIVKCKTCGAEIAKSAKVCPRCGAPRKSHTVLGIFLVIIGVALFVNGMSNFDTSTSADSKPSQNKENAYDAAADPADIPSDERAESENKPTISKDEFDSISTGMTYDEVVEVIGSEGEVLSEVDLDIGEQYKTIMYMWKGEGSLGANANITFQDGKVTAKAQIGLK